MNLDPKLDFDSELIADFHDSFDDAQMQIQEILVALEQASDKSAELDALFRELHSIKGNCRMLQLNHLSDFIHKLEDILDDMRGGQLEYDTWFSDVLLLSLDLCHEMSSSFFAGDSSEDERLGVLMQALDKMHNEHSRFDEHLHTTLGILDPQLLDNDSDNVGQTEADMAFFHSVARFFESRLGYDEGMTRRVLDMAEQLNALAGHPVDINQLRVAVYAHDMGMAFLDQTILDKFNDLTDEERQVLQAHPQLGAQLLEQLGHWQEASQIVSQHHERFDGTGYPEQLAGDQICSGAKILAIVDTFEAMTHTRAHREHKRTELRVIAEINANSGYQFDPYWVHIFNLWMREVLVKKRTQNK